MWRRGVGWGGFCPIAASFVLLPLVVISALMDLVVEWHPDSCSCSDNLTLKVTYGTHESLHLDTLLQHAKVQVKVELETKR